MSARDNNAIDFGKMRILYVFRRMFIPTFLGLLATSVMNVVDGMFVGRGVGSDALAAINIASPLFMIATGIALMFGSGASVVASVLISRNDVEGANASISRAFVLAFLVMAAIVALVEIFPCQTASVFGSSDRLLPLVCDYFYYVVPGLLLAIIFNIGMYIIRLDGAPVFAMMCNLLPAVLNIVLDYVFVFPLDMGIKGAGLASLLSDVVGAAMVFHFMCFRASVVRFSFLEAFAQPVAKLLGELVYMARLGFSAMIGELSVSAIMIVGNYSYMRYLGEDGVAAFSVACYTIPVVTMIAASISSSAQPIISHNYGLNQKRRVFKTIYLSMLVAVSSGLLCMVLGMFFSPFVVGLFVDSSSPSYSIAVSGFPLYSASFLILSINMVMIGVFQSVEDVKPANLFNLLRGVILVLPALAFLPMIIGVPGLWLSQPLAELVTFVAICIYVFSKVFSYKV